MYRELRSQRFTTPLEDLVSAAQSEVESLAGELRDWHDNLPEGINSSDKAAEIDEAATTLENITFPDLPDAVATIKVLHQPALEQDSRPKRSAEDREALPAPSSAAPAPAEAYAAPKGDVAAKIAAVWARVLNLPQIGARDNFFALGGHSLLAVQAHREIRAALGTTRLSITDIFRFPTLDALARHLDGGAATVPAPAAEPVAAAQAETMSKRRALRAGRGA